MIPTTFKFEIRHEPYKNGKYGLLLRVTQNRKFKRVKSSVSLDKLREWNNASQCVRASNPDAKVLNQALKMEYNNAWSVYQRLAQNGLETLDNIIKALKSDADSEKPMLFQYTKRVYNRLLDEGKYETWRRYGTFVHYLGVYLDKKGVSDVKLKEVTPEFVEDFNNFLNKQTNRNTHGKLVHNTIAKYMKTFRAVVGRAISEGYINIQDNPFRNFRIREERVTKQSLEDSEIASLANIELKPFSALWNARNAFLFAYYCEGMRISDLLQLRWCNISASNMISYQMGKNKKPKCFTLRPEAVGILNQYKRPNQKPTDYIFPFLDNNAEYAKAITQDEKSALPEGLGIKLMNSKHSAEVHVNKNLKKLAQMVGITKRLTFHVSRHSFANKASNAGVEATQLQSAMGHSSLSTTQRYLDEVNTSKEDAVLNKIFGNDKVSQLEKMLEGLSEEDRKKLFAKFVGEPEK